MLGSDAPVAVVTAPVTITCCSEETLDACRSGAAARASVAALVGGAPALAMPARFVGVAGATGGTARSATVDVTLSAARRGALPAFLVESGVKAFVASSAAGDAAPLACVAMLLPIRRVDVAALPIIRGISFDVDTVTVGAT